MASREKISEHDCCLWAVRQRLKEAQEEVKDLRALINTQQQELEEYKHKYLDEQHHVEKLRKQIDQLPLENDRIISEQVKLEVRKVKNEFQEKLNKLAPLHDVLVETEQTLQDYQQMYSLAVRNNEALECELQCYKEKAAEMKSQIEKMQNNQKCREEERASMEQRVQELERKLRDAVEENNGLKANICQTEERIEENKKRVEKKLHEIAQQVLKLETVKEESASASLVAQTKDRYGTACNCKNMND